MTRHAVMAVCHKAATYFFLTGTFAVFTLDRLAATFLDATFLATAFFLGAAFLFDAGDLLTTAFLVAFFLAFGVTTAAGFPSPTFCARVPSAEPTAIAAFFKPSALRPFSSLPISLPF